MRWKTNRIQTKKKVLFVFIPLLLCLVHPLDKSKNRLSRSLPGQGYDAKLDKYRVQSFLFSSPNKIAPLFVTIHLQNCARGGAEEDWGKILTGKLLLLDSQVKEMVRWL